MLGCRAAYRGASQRRPEGAWNGSSEPSSSQRAPGSVPQRSPSRLRPGDLAPAARFPAHRNQEASGLCLKWLRLGQLCPRHFLADHWEPQDSTGRGRGDAPVFTNDKSLTETRAGILASCLPLLRPRLALLSAEGPGVWVRRGHRGSPRGVPEGSSPTGRPAQASRFGPCGKFQPHI